MWQFGRFSWRLCQNACWGIRLVFRSIYKNYHLICWNNLIHSKKMIVAVIIFFILVLQRIRVTLLLSTISKSTTDDTTPTQFVAKPIVLVPWTRTNLMAHAVLPIQCVNMMWTVLRNILKMFNLKHFVEINITYWFILVELVYMGKFSCQLAKLWSMASDLGTGLSGLDRTGSRLLLT